MIFALLVAIAYLYAINNNKKMIMRIEEIKIGAEVFVKKGKGVWVPFLGVVRYFIEGLVVVQDHEFGDYIEASPSQVVLLKDYKPEPHTCKDHQESADNPYCTVCGLAIS